VHEFGRTARKAIDGARLNVARLLGARDADEIVFTGSGTESDNFALKGALGALKAKGNHIITSAIEHPAVLNVCKALEEADCKVTYVPVDQYGIIKLDELKRAVTNKTILISVMYANNETGVIQPVDEIARIAKEKGILFHTDAVQAVGKVPIDAAKLGVDLLSASAHKIYGPKGVGALYVKRGIKIASLIQGGHHEKNRRAGTENVAGITGFGKAAELAVKNMDGDSARIKALRDRLEKGILNSVPHTYLNGHPDKRLCTTANISFEYLEGESIILNLDMEGVAVSTGSACTSGSLEPSHVLTAMGINAVLTQGSLRFSLGKGNTEEDIDYVIKALPPIIERLRRMSPLYKGGCNCDGTDGCRQ
jgi:cysteine desulfurase